MLTPCAECGNQISTLAASRPQCGAPMNQKQTTIERTSKSVNAQQLLSILTMVVGACMAIADSAQGAAAGAVLFIVGALWLLAVAFVGWWKNG